MKSFKQWIEELTHFDTVPPNERTKNLHISLKHLHPNNQQQMKSWDKKNTKQIFQFPLEKEKFIHFTLKENVPLIIQTKKLEGDHSIFAVSLSYGVWFPIVQYNHIISKSKKNFIPTHALRNPTKKQRLLDRGMEIPSLKDEIAAVVFQTNQIPKIAHAEEVIWDGPVNIYNFKEVDSRMAINLLKHSPYQIGSEDQVQYIKQEQF